jgi:hypothetical protein
MMGISLTFHYPTTPTKDRLIQSCFLYPSSNTPFYQYDFLMHVSDNCDLLGINLKYHSKL